MRAPSRRMPTYSKQPVTLRAKAFLAAASLGLLIAIYHASAAQIAVAVVAIATIWLVAIQTGKRDKACLDGLASSRGEGSICTFARSFDRQVDTWVIRAVYEELQEQIGSHRRRFPIRAQDELVKDLRLDPEDIDLSLAPAVAQRTGRMLEKKGHNPYRGNVHSVADLVMFFNLQPRQSDSPFKPKSLRSAESRSKPA